MSAGKLITSTLIINIIASNIFNIFAIFTYAGADKTSVLMSKKP